MKKTKCYLFTLAVNMSPWKQQQTDGTLFTFCCDFVWQENVSLCFPSAWRSTERLLPHGLTFNPPHTQQHTLPTGRMCCCGRLGCHYLVLHVNMPKQVGSARLFCRPQQMRRVERSSNIDARSWNTQLLPENRKFNTQNNFISLIYFTLTTSVFISHFYYFKQQMKIIYLHTCF